MDMREQQRKRGKEREGKEMTLPETFSRISL